MHHPIYRVTRYTVYKPFPPIGPVNRTMTVFRGRDINLAREKTAVLSDKLQTLGRGTSCPLIRLLLAKELYTLKMYQATITHVNR